MNKAKMIELFLDGAYYVVTEQRLYHSSFRKGYRSITSGNISLVAAKRALGEQLHFAEDSIKIK
jgi:hypothetical protein